MDAEVAAQLRNLAEKVGELEEELSVERLKVSALYGALLEKDVSAPGIGTKMERIMSVVKLVEQGQWGAKTLVWFFLTIGSLMAAYAGIKAGFGK